MKITKRLNEFIKEVANAASGENNSPFSFSECVNEYTDQIETDDYLCVVTYADSIGIKIPRALKGILKGN